MDKTKTGAAWVFARNPITSTLPVDVSGDSGFRLEPCFPNPFSQTTSIRYDVPHSGPVKLVVLDVLGREVASLLNKPLSEGSYLTDFNADQLTNGIYYYRLQVDNFMETRRMQLIR